MSRPSPCIISTCNRQARWRVRWAKRWWPKGEQRRPRPSLIELCEGHADIATYRYVAGSKRTGRVTGRSALAYPWNAYEVEKIA